MSCTCSALSAFLPALTFGLVSSSISSSTFCAAGAGRQLGHDQLPLAAGEVLDLPARAHLQPAAAGGVGLADVGRAADDLAAAGIVGPRQQREELVVGQLLVADQRDRGGRHFAQVVRRHLGRQAHRDAARAVEQHEGQARRQLPRLLGRAVVVGDEVDRAFVDLVEQQPRDRREPRLGVAHRRGAVAVARAEVALPVDQRIALREVLRHAHQRVVGGLVAMRVEAAEHVAHHARALHRLGPGCAGEGQPHALHRVQDAPLHRLLAVADVRQRAALDDAERVLEVGALGVGGEGEGVGIVAGGNLRVSCSMDSVLGGRVSKRARGSRKESKKKKKKKSSFASNRSNLKSAGILPRERRRRASASRIRRSVSARSRGTRPTRRHIFFFFFFFFFFFLHGTATVAAALAACVVVILF